MEWDAMKHLPEGDDEWQESQVRDSVWCQLYNWYLKKMT